MRAKLGDVTENLDYKRVPIAQKDRADLEKLYPYYGAQGIVDYVDDYIFDGEYLLVAEDGENLRSRKNSIVTFAKGKFWVNNHAHILGEKAGTNLTYIYYLLKGLDLSGYITGSAQPKLTQENLSRLEIDIPDVQCQKDVATLLSTIDAKIDNNNAIAAELEGMAKDLYDYWFVQFNFPDENGKPYKSSGGKMVWNEELKREIPEGWEVSQLKDICFLRNGINYDKNEVGDADFKIANVRNITASTFLMDVNDFDVIHLKKEKAKQYSLKPEDIVIARSGTPGAIRLVQNPKNDTIFCGFIICCTPKVAKYRNYMAYTLKLFEGTSATKTGGSILQNVSQDTLNSLILCIPPDELIEKFNIMITSILEEIQNTINESRELTSLRDFLLPMLMNGQVKVKGA